LAARSLPAGASREALVLALATPLLFLHRAYQPSLGVHVGGTTVTAYLADFAVLAIVVAGLSALRRDGLRRLGASLPLWVAGVLFIVWIGVEVLYGHHRSASYPTSTHAVTAAKFAEYALLAPAIALILRGAGDLLALLWSLALWDAAATVLGVAQFFGAHILLPHYTGGRASSFVGWDEFAGLSCLVLLMGLVALLLPRLGLGRRFAALAIAAGGLGAVVAGAIAAVLGLITAAFVLALLARYQRAWEPRRVLAGAGVVLVVAGGAIAIRGGDLHAFARFLGAHEQTQQKNVQTYSHRTLLSWIGWEIWTEHKPLGVGWQASGDPYVFKPVLPAAHARFPSLSPVDFPSVQHPWGVQNAWVQSAADLGIPGFLLWIAVFAAAAWAALRGIAAHSGAAPLLGLVGVAALAWIWLGEGFIAGVPTDALTGIAFGLAAARMSAA
jgi:O-antigen ligase